MKILLFGANGRLGAQLLRLLDACGPIVCCVRPGTPWREEDGSKRREVKHVDMARQEQIGQVVRDVRPQLIVNAAAYTAVEVAEREPTIATAINAAAPGVLAREANALGAALIHYSTDYVFGGQTDRAWREDDAPHPLNVYGATKLAGEEAIRSAGAAHLIIRTSWLYAIRGPSFVKKMFTLANRDNVITVVDDQIGAPTSARFVAHATAAIVARANEDPASYFRAHGGTLHVACAGETSWFGYASEIFRQARDLDLAVTIPSLRPIASADRAGSLARPLNSRLDTHRLGQQFSISAPRWEDELKDHLPALHAQFVREGADS